MRIAVLIIGIFAIIAITFQSCTVGVLGTVIAAKDNSGAKGMAVVVFYVLGTAFAYGLPFVAAPLFLCAALIGFSAKNFPDLHVWAWIAVFLACMSVIGGIGRRREKKRGLKS